MERQQGMVVMVISRILIFETAVDAWFTQGAAPGIGKLIRKPVRESFGDLQGHRMIGRTARIRVLDYGRVLGIGNDEVVREAVLRHQAAGSSGNSRGCVQSAGKLTDIAICQECFEDRVTAQ